MFVNKALSKNNPRKYYKIAAIVFSTLLLASFFCYSKLADASGITGAYYAENIDVLLIEGSGFGSSQGESTVLLEETNLGQATVWSENSIYFSAPSKKSGALTINIYGGSSYSANVVKLDTYTSYPSDNDISDPNLVSYWPFDTDFEDKKGSNDFRSSHNQLDNVGQFINSFEAVRIFAEDWRPLLDHDPGGNRSKRKIAKIGNDIIMLFYDGTWQYTISSDNGRNWSSSIEKPESTFSNLPMQMDNGEWLYWKMQGSVPNQELVFAHSSNVTIDNIFDPPNLTFLDPISLPELSNNWTTNFHIQWQIEDFGDGKVALMAYKYYAGPDAHGGALIVSEDYGYTWQFREISEGRVINNLSLASDITAGDTTIELTDTSDLYPSGTISLNDDSEFVSYGAIEGNTLLNVRYSQTGEYITDERLDENNPGVRNDYLAAETTVTQNCYTLGEPTVVLDPNDSNHIISFQRSEGRAPSYIFKRESYDMGQTWTSYPHTIYLGAPQTAEPVRGNNHWAYWTSDAGGEQGRIYIFARHWGGTKYFYSDDGGETFVGNNQECSYSENDRFCLRTGNTWIIANDMNSLLSTPDKNGFWLFWNYANSIESSPPGDGELSVITAKLYFNHDDATLGKNTGYTKSLYDSSLDLSEYSIDFWINLRYDHKFLEGAIVNRMSGDGSAANYDIRILGVGDNYNKIQFRQYNDLTSSWNTITSNNRITSNNWHHVVASYDGEKIRLFVDGVLEEEETSTSSHSGTEPLFIGFDPSYDTLNFRGQLDNLKIWNKALDAKDILNKANWEEPTIASVSPNSAVCNTEITIDGNGFGDTKEQNYLSVGGIRIDTNVWSETQIKAIIPCSLLAGNHNVVVNVSGHSSNEKIFQLIANEIVAEENESAENNEISRRKLIAQTIEKLIININNSFSIIWGSIKDDQEFKYFSKFSKNIISNSKLIFSGFAIPNGLIKVFVHSDQEIILETIADDEGYWEVKLQEGLALGQHEIYIEVTDPETFKVERSLSYNFEVVKDEEYNNLFQENSGKENSASSKNVLYWCLPTALVVTLLSIQIYKKITNKTKGL